MRRTSRFTALALIGASILLCGCGQAPGSAASAGMTPSPSRYRGVEKCVVRVTSAWSPAEALANLIGEFAQACGHRFRGRYFPECPGHGHAASLDLGPGEVILRCPDSAEVVEQLVSCARNSL